MAVIRLIRHGQASFGIKNYDQLSDLGIEQARLLGRSLKRRVADVDLVVCGEMDRHMQTAETTMKAMGLTLTPQIDPAWNEYDHEELIVRHKPSYRSKTVMLADLARRGDPKRQFQLVFDEALERWTGGEHDDYSESWQDFVTRVVGGLESLPDDANVLVFTSGGPVSAVSASSLGLSVESWLRFNRNTANCSETKVVTGRSGISLVTWNAHPWFDAERELISYR
jgi:broad specificity phosphatase PhoE